MKIFLTGSVGDEKKLPALAMWMESTGHRVVSTWYMEFKKLPREMPDRDSIATLLWRVELDDCDAIIYYAGASKQISTTSCVEIGYALAQNKEVYHIGFPRPADPYFSRYMKTWPACPPPEVESA